MEALVGFTYAMMLVLLAADWTESKRFRQSCVGRVVATVDGIWQEITLPVLLTQGPRACVDVGVII